MTTISKETFDITGASIIISGTAGQQIKIVGIIIINNATDLDDYCRVRLRDTPSANALYGSDDAPVFLCGEAGSWGLQVTRESVNFPYFILPTGDGFLMQSVDGERISGAVWYFKE